jgi:bifunctional non-homologous end joining protein LigD
MIGATAILRSSARHLVSIDGEALAQDGNGISDFEGLNSAILVASAQHHPLAFDLMHLDGADIRQQPLSVRRSMLKALIGADEESRVQFS